MAQNNHNTTNSKQPKPMGGGPMGKGRPGEKAKNFKKSFVQLLGFLKPYTLSIIISIILAIGGTVFVVVNPKILGNITTEVGEAIFGARQIDLHLILNIGILLIAFYILSFICETIQGYLMNRVTAKSTYTLRKQISLKINKLPLNYYDTTQYGEILSRITNDVDTISQTLSQSLSSMITNVVRVIGMFIMMLSISPSLTFLSLATIPLTIIILLVIIKFSQKFFKSQQQTLGQLNGYVEEMYSAHDIIKAYNGKEQVVNDFETLNNKMYQSAWKSQFTSGLMMPLIQFIGNLGFIIVCIVGGNYALEGIITIGAIQSMIMYIRQFNQPLAQIASISSTLQSTVAASERVFDFLNQPEQADHTNLPSLLQNVQGKVQFENVKFSYIENNPIIQDFSLKVKKGQKIAIVGPTGAGKTTIVNLLMRFYEINSGNIKIDDISIYDTNRDNVRECFGMVLQDTWLFEGTIRDNLKFNTPNITDEQMIEACKNANIHHFIMSHENGYDMILDDNTNISAGQKQLLTIARAMIENSPMLILDEATSSVDTRTEGLIQDAMDKLTIGRTSLIIAHRLSTIKNADVILVLDKGNVIEQGSHNQLMKLNGFYTNLHNSQFSNN